MVCLVRQGGMSQTYSWRGDVGEICCNTWSVDNIVECKFGDEGRCLEKEGQWLDVAIS